MPPVVIGLTGASRSGKSWVAKTLAESLSLPRNSCIGQDRFFKRSVQVKLPDGTKVMSEEEPACIDSGKFVDAIVQAVSASKASNQPAVIVEGFQLLHDPRVAPLLDHIFLFDLSQDECIRRRSSKAGPLNQHPMSAKKCNQLLWPAHERYMQNSILPLEEAGSIQRLQAPSNETEVAEIVHRIYHSAILKQTAAEEVATDAMQQQPESTTLPKDKAAVEPIVPPVC